MAKVSASLLNCDHTRIGEQVLAIEYAGAHFIHIDVMDGVYVENMAFDPQTVTDLKRICHLPVSVHLEVYHPEHIAPMFIQAGADIITFQLDACQNPLQLLRRIRLAGKKAGIGISPTHGIENLKYLLPHIDWLILMSVEPGFGGQPFENSIYEKLKSAQILMNQYNYHVPISIDGGVNLETGRHLVNAGADILISGSYLFTGSSISKQVTSLLSL